MVCRREKIEENAIEKVQVKSEILFQLKMKFWNPLKCGIWLIMKNQKINNFENTALLQLYRSVKHTHIQTYTHNYGATSSVAQFFHPEKLYLI